MPEPIPSSRVVRFGLFEVDLLNGELRKNGLIVKLQERPFEILAILLERPGEVVTREEFRQRLWPADTFVDFDHSMNASISKLRVALGEDAENPRFVGTVGRRGYRFIAPVLGPETLSPPKVTAIGPGKDIGAAGRVSRSTWYVLMGTILVFIVLTSLLAWQQFRLRTLRPAGRVMLAVLPFQNLTGDAGQNYFSDGLTEEMITQLGNADPQRLGVIARTSVMHYKNSQTPLDQVGRELGVQYVVEGSVRRDSNNVRITAQLILAKDQTHVWARQYDRELKGLLVLQGEIAQEIADEIQLTLGHHRSSAELAVPPQSYQAYDLYLKGQYFFNKRTVGGLEEAIGYFQRATEKDANYARAYASLADCYALIPGYAGLPQGEFVEKARAAALKALEIDEGLPEAHTALALVVQNYDWDWQTAEKEFRRAIELNPNYATAHHWYAEHLAWRGRFDEALQESERARQLDPLSLIIAADNGAILFFARQYDRAIEKWRFVLEIDPDFPRAGLIAVAYAEKGMPAEALAAVEKRRPTDSASPWWYWSLTAYIYARSGQTAKARHALDELLKTNRLSPIDPRILAWNYAALGDKDQALAWLEKAYAQHSNELVSLKVNPGFDSLRSDPRFQDLLRRVGLAP